MTGYWSYWKNKTLMSDKYKPVDGEEKKFMINGLDAEHYGAEIEIFHRFTHWFKLSAYASAGNWFWKNDVQANIYDEYNGNLIGRTDIFTKGLHVGDAPQTQIGAAAEFHFLKNFDLKASWSFNDRMFADFDPSARTDPEDRSESWKIPSWQLLDLHLSWTPVFKGKYRLSIFADCGNVLDTEYIERGKDGQGHDRETFRGFWGFGRNFSFGIRLKL